MQVITLLDMVFYCYDVPGLSIEFLVERISIESQSLVGGHTRNV